MADTANDVGSSRRPQPGSLAAEANAAVRPVSMPVVARVATAVPPIVRDARRLGVARVKP